MRCSYAAGAEIFPKLVLVLFKVMHLFSHWSLSYVHFSHYRVLGAAIKQPIHHCTRIGSERLTGTDFLEMEKNSNEEWHELTEIHL